MSRLAALLRKELWHHGAVMAALFALLGAVALLLLLGALLAPRTMTLLETHASFVRFFLPLAALALGHRLVVQEYRAGTHRFLEALPLRRIDVVLTKLLVGLALMSVLALASLALSTLAAGLREPLTLRWIALVALKTELFALALFSVLFALGLLGRWRVAVYLGLGFVLLFVEQATRVELGRFGPFALVGERFVLEREAIPWSEGAVTLGLAASAVGLALVLSLSREGALVDGMARPMSARETTAVGAVLVAGLIAAELADDWRDRPAFAFSREEVVRRADPDLAVLYLEEPHRARAEALADVLHADLARLRRELGLARLAPVHVALRETLDPRLVERVELDGREGILLRARFTSEGLDLDDLRAAVLERALEVATDGRAAFEPYAWARTGLARAIVHADEPAPPRAPLLRALYLTREQEPSLALLERWQETEERFGPAGAEVLAYAAFRGLEARAGRERASAFARAAFGTPPLPGALALLEDWRAPPMARLARETGLGPAELEEAWRRELAVWRADPRARALAELPRASASLALEREGALPVLRWTVRFDRPPPPEAICSLLHAAVGPFDAPLAADAWLHEERRCLELDPEGERLVGRYGAGERVLLAVELHDPRLGAPMRLAAERMELP